MRRLVLGLALGVLYMASSPTSVGIAVPAKIISPISPQVDRLKAIEAAFGKCGNPCVVNYNQGGYIDTFQSAGDAILAEPGMSLVINGKCLSGCAIAADRARERACITEKASFHFHKTYVKMPAIVNGKEQYVRTMFRDPPQSQQVDSWVRESGDYPVDGWNIMRFKNAQKFWPQCWLEGAPQPRPDPRRAKARRYFLYAYLWYGLGRRTGVLFGSAKSHGGAYGPP